MTEAFNAGSYLVDRQVESGHGQDPALRCAGRSVTYAALADLMAEFHGGLVAGGLARGDRVMFVCSDRAELVAGILGAFRAGMVAVPVSTMFTGPELAKLVIDSEARVVVVSPEFVEHVEEALALTPLPPRILVTLDRAPITVPPGVVVRDWQEFLSPAKEPAVVTSEDEIALWLYTSGTTGTPKGAMHRHGNLRAVCEGYAQEVLGIVSTDVCYSVAKAFFAYGLGNSVLFPLSIGATAVLDPRRPSPAGVAELVRTQQPTLFFAGPTFFAALLDADLPVDTFASVRLIASAGEALPAALLNRFMERFGVEVLDGIGSTEALHIFLSNRAGDVHPGTSGRAVSGYAVEIRDASGAVVPDGEPGSLFIKGSSVATGYWQRAEATAAVFQSGWLSTGDTYVRSADGYYTCLGRSGDLLKAGGIWVSPAEVEDRLLQHSAVSEAVVVAVTDSNGLDKPVACVVARAGETLDPVELEQWCRQTLAAFKRPRAFLILDSLPKTATGKVQRFRLRETVSEQQLLPAGH